jgi:uncharacterized protein YciU (UPF0263 family)
MPPDVWCGNRLEVIVTIIWRARRGCCYTAVFISNEHFMQQDPQNVTPDNSSELELWSMDELCDHAFSIFEELASENLTAADYELYQQHYESRAYVDLVPPAADWVELIQAELEPELHFEALIGLSGEQGGADLVLARILLSREKYDSLCHAQWRGQ